MRGMPMRWMAVAVLTVLAAGPVLWAADGAATTITVKGMTCPVCAKAVAEKLQAVPGVASVKIDTEKQTAQVVPQKGKTASPRALWEAVEKAEYQPVKLQGPGGTFTQKPTS